MIPLMVGIAGGTCAGKTTLVENIRDELAGIEISSIQFDFYYRPIDHLSMAERAQVNFDCLDSLDVELFSEHLSRLKQGKSAPAPVYDFSSHSRTPEIMEISPAQIVMVEGILLLAEPRLVDLLDLKIYLDVEADIRLARRVCRDMAERGRSAASVIEQYLASVRPMHELFVEPSRQLADLVVYRGGMDLSAISTVAKAIKERLS